VDADTPGTTAAFSATNRLASSWADYDSAGNLTHFKFPDQLALDWTAAYDGENKQRFFCANDLGACTSANADAEYRYDGNGNRVQKLTAAKTVTYVYDAFGKLAAEYSTQTSAVSGTFYRTTDHLGSTRLVTDDQGGCKVWQDFYPFGERILGGASTGRQGWTCYGGADTDAFEQEFTAKEPDQESGLDYFESRYFGSALGRFASPDVMMGKPEWLVDPQRWNRYAYVRNNPLKHVDPSGEDLVIYYSLGRDVSDEDREWFNKNKATILGAIQAKFEEAGVKNVSPRDQSTLTKDQIAELDKGAPFGVSRLTFVGKEYPGLGQVPMMGVLGYAHPDGKGIAGVFLDTFPKVPTAGCDQACMAANVGAHELGHTLGMPHLGFFQEIADKWRQRPAMLGGTETRPDLMTGSMGTPTQPLYFKPETNDRTRRAIEQLNRIGDMTPKK
jgi:RHS repeat-associated protein